MLLTHMTWAVWPSQLFQPTAPRCSRAPFTPKIVAVPGGTIGAASLCARQRRGADAQMLENLTTHGGLRGGRVRIASGGVPL